MQPTNQVTHSVPTDIKGILLDIEGTTSSISFVYDKMFPYIRNHLADFMNEHWNDPKVAEVVSILAEEASVASLVRQAAEREVIRLMDEDVKSTGLKQLQGLIWRSGFVAGELVAHVYEDVPIALSAWKNAGLDIRIYSSGSVEAQKLFFGHSQAGNLLPMFSGHYDTKIGAKRESASYQKIASEFAIPVANILFISDVVAELSAADQAGMQTRLSLRPGNPPQEANGYTSTSSFLDIAL